LGANPQQVLRALKLGIGTGTSSCGKTAKYRITLEFNYLFHFKFFGWRSKKLHILAILALTYVEKKE